MSEPPSRPLTLSLRPRERPAPADAFVLTMRSPKRWIDLLRDAEVTLDLCEGYILPLSLRDRSPGGLLLVAGAEGLASFHNPRVQGFRLLGTRLLIPCQADLRPALDPGEMDALIHHHLALFHPAIGLIAFEEGDRTDLARFLRPWKDRTSNFSWAHPGPPVQDRLYAITAMPVPRVDLLLEDAREGIGTEPAESLPPSPWEQEESAVRRWRNQMKLRFLDALKKLGGKGDERGREKSGWRRKLEAWTEARVEALRRDQERELQRLLHLLKTDPDEGLKYALPLGGGTERGMVPPPSRLPERRADFNLDHLRGGRPGAPWVVDWQKHHELSRRYREAASREVRLGRHRRAAYIFAELLKDYSAAGNVLRQGRHFREASVIYLKHLGNPLEAAHCLREGGYLLEAIPILEKKKQYETVAELHEQLGQTEEAARFYRLAVSRCLAHGQTLKAADLLEHQLDSVDDAIALLQSTWPGAPDAITCLRQELSLYDRLGRPADLRARLEEVAGNHPREKALGLMGSLVQVARQSPDAEMRAVAERCGYIVAGRWLGTPDARERRLLLDRVRELVPGDRLLVTDTIRFAAQCEEETREREGQVLDGSKDKPLAWIDRTPLPNWVRWMIAKPDGREGLLALGVAAHGVTLMRYRWGGAFQTQRLAGVTEEDLDACELEVTRDALPDCISLVGKTDLQPGILAPSDGFSRAVRVENPPWVKERHFLGMTYGGRGVAWVLSRNGPDDDLLVLSSYSSMGDLIATHTIELPFVPGRGMLAKPVAMIHAREQILFACGRHLVRFYRDRVDTLDMGTAPLRLYHSAAGVLQIAASHETGAEVFWGDAAWGRRRSIPLDVRRPVMTFTRTGDVLAASEGRLDLLGVRQSEFEPLACEALDGGEDAVPLGLFATDTPSVYALVTAREVRRVRVQPWQKATR